MSQLSILDNPTAPELQLLCVFVFEVVIQNFTKIETPIIFPEIFNTQKYPVLVSWYTGDEQKFRGSMGSFDSDFLEKNLRKFAMASAFHDPNYPPIDENEVPALNCVITILVNFQDAKDCYDWDVRRNGIQISFEENGRHYTNTLPDEPYNPDDPNLDKKKILQELIKKAGYDGKLEAIESKIKTRRYQRIKTSMNFHDYFNFQRRKMDKEKNKDISTDL